MILEDLPSCFLKDYDSGLGLAPSYKIVADAVTALSKCEEIVISKDRDTGPDDSDKRFYITTRDVEWIRKFINRTETQSQIAARSVKHASTYNFLAEKLGQPLVPVEVGRSPARKRFTDMLIQGEDTLSPADQDLAVEALTKHTNSIVKTKPEKLASLKRNIELVTLDALIDRYEQMIASRLPESRWQAFLEENRFVLSLAFGYPVLKVKDQPSVGGHTLTGTGGKIADFLVKNSMTNNSAIIEIKTPQTKMLNTKLTRNGIYTPSSPLLDAVSQALDQKYHFEQEIAQIKANSRLPDIESYSVRCCLIVGQLPTVEDKIKSFELFRGNSKYVDIVTFDELLGKLKQLRDLLAVQDDAPTVQKDAPTVWEDAPPAWEDASPGWDDAPPAWDDAPPAWDDAPTRHIDEMESPF